MCACAATPCVCMYSSSTVCLAHVHPHRVRTEVSLVGGNSSSSNSSNDISDDRTALLELHHIRALLLIPPYTRRFTAGKILVDFRGTTNYLVIAAAALLLLLFSCQSSRDRSGSDSDCLPCPIPIMSLGLVLESGFWTRGTHWARGLHSLSISYRPYALPRSAFGRRDARCSVRRRMRSSVVGFNARNIVAGEIRTVCRSRRGPCNYLHLHRAPRNRLISACCNRCLAFYPRIGPPFRFDGFSLTFFLVTEVNNLT